MDIIIILFSDFEPCSNCDSIVVSGKFEKAFEYWSTKWIRNLHIKNLDILHKINIYSVWHYYNAPPPKTGN